MKRIHTEFAYQSRELGGQIDGILGDPPNRKNYDSFVNALRKQYAAGSGVEDVNLMSFALVDHLSFKNPAALLAAGAHYDGGAPADVIALASCDAASASAMLAAIALQHPALTRKAIITAFLYKNQRLWKDEDQSLDALAANDDGDDVDDDALGASDNFTGMFDHDGDENDR